VSPDESEVTALLERWSEGDADALGELIPVVFDQVRDLAHRHLAREAPGHTWQTTELVHEVYLRLVDRRQVQWQNRAQFFGYLAEVMRRLLIDHARRRLREKRGSGVRPLPLDDVFGLAEKRPPELLALDDALAGLAHIDPRQSRIVELRFFIGLTLQQIADVLGVSLATVNRDWRSARMWLLRQLAAGSD